MDMSYLPEDLREDLAEGFEKARERFPLMQAIKEADRCRRFLGLPSGP
jgi:hypothetical protein